MLRELKKMISSKKFKFKKIIAKIKMIRQVKKDS
jgi:hypothetical protein